MQLDEPGVEVLHVLVLPAPVLAEGHDVADELLGRDYGDVHIGLAGLLDGGGVGVVVGVVHAHDAAVGLFDLVDDGGQGRDEVEVELALQPLLDDLHVQHAEEAAAEAEAEGDGALRLVGERSVVELELVKGVAQVGIFGAVLRVDAAVDHGPGGGVAGQGLGGGAHGLRHRVAHLGVRDVFDAGGEISDVAGREFLTGLEARGPQVSDLDDLVHRARGHELYLHVLAHAPVHDPHEHDDAAEGVVLAVEHEGLERRVRISLRRGHAPDDLLQHRGDVDAVFGGDLRGLHGGDADDVLYFGLGPGRVGGREVYLVYDGEYLKVVVHGEVGVCQGLGLDALGGVHDEQRPLAGGERARDLVVEVHVARGVYEVQGVLLAVFGSVIEADGAGLDGDAALLFEVHVVEDLALHLPALDGAAELYEPVG